MKARHRQQTGKRPHIWNRTPNIQERKEAIQRDIKRRMKLEGIIEDKIPFIWEWRLGDKFGTVTSFTKSEARSEIKQSLNISKKKPLPCNIQIRKIEFNEPLA